MHNQNLPDLKLIFRKFLHDLGNISSGVITAVDFVDNNNSDIASNAKLLLSHSSKLLYSFIKIYHLLLAGTDTYKMKDHIEVLFKYKKIDYSFSDIISVCSSQSIQYYVLFIYDTMNQGGKIITKDKRIIAVYNNNSHISSSKYADNIWYKYLSSCNDIKITCSDDCELSLESI